MNNNPYESPEASSETSTEKVIGVLSGSREDLRRVASYQKGILVCILVYIGLVVATLLLPGLAEKFRIALILVGVASSVFVLLLGMRAYGTALGILFGLLSLIPCIGVIVLLLVNSRASHILQQNGIKVGLMGADPSKI